MRRPLLFVSSFLLTLIAAEATVRVVDSSLPDPRPWPTHESRLKTAQLEALSEPVNVVVVGTSVSEAAIDPAIVSGDLGGTVYNASLPFGTPVGLEVWIEQFVLPLAQPDLVVLGLLPYGMSSGASDDPLRQGLLGVLDPPSSMERLSALARHRSQLRQLPDLLRTRPPDPALWTDDGHQTAYYDGVSPAVAAVAEPGGDVSYSRENYAAVERIVMLVRETGASIVFLIEPGGCPPALTSCPGEGEANDHARRLQELADRMEVPVVDGRLLAAVPDWYADTAHFNRLGTVAFSSFFASELALVIP